ncbi:hypothetical protein IPH67_01250 [bacterium]|nr:MAG: hypothetical protein IPH67_01250 [bacterium]
MKAFFKIFTGKTYRFAATFLILVMLCMAIFDIKTNSKDPQLSTEIPFDLYLESADPKAKETLAIPLEKKIWKAIVDPGQWPDGEALKPITLDSVSRGDRRDLDWDGPEGTAYVEKGLPPKQKFDKQTINQQIKKLAQLFVKDVGELCNEKVLHSFEGLESLKRLWLNRYDHALAAEQQIQLQKPFYKSMLAKKHIFSENPILVIRSFDDQGLRDGEYDLQFNQEVEDELKIKNIRPYTPEELEQKKAELRTLYPDKVNYRFRSFQATNEIRVFSTQYSQKNEEGRWVMFPVTLEAVFDRFLGNPKNISIDEKYPSITLRIDTNKRSKYAYFLTADEHVPTLPNNENEATQETSFWSKLRPYNHILRYAAIGSFCCASVGFVGYKIHQWWKHKKTAKKKLETKK